MILQQSKRGSIMLLALFFLMILNFLAFAFAALIPVESRAAIKTERDVAGLLCADAGIADALGWLRNTIAPPDGSASQEPMDGGVYPSLSERTGEVGDGWSYTWTLVPDAETYPNGNNPVRAFTIESVASLHGTPYRVVRVQCIQESFAKYQSFTNEWANNIVHPVGIGTRMPGAMHSNGTVRLWLRDGGSYWTDTGEPHFAEGLTAHGVFDTGDSAADGFAYYQGNWIGGDPSKIPYEAGVGPVASRYNRMSEGGREAMKSGYQEQVMPYNTFDLRDAAWGFSGNPLPSTDGVYINTDAGQVDGGIYIEGDVDEMQLGVGGTALSKDGGGSGLGTVSYGDNSWVKIEQGSQSIQNDDNATTVVTVEDNPVTLPAGSRVNGAVVSGPTIVSTGSTLVRHPDGSWTSYPGLPNGVVYTSGDVENLWGVNKGRRTVAAEMRGTYDADGDLVSVDAARRIYIGGEESDPSGNVSNAADRKGLVQFGANDGDGDGVLDPPDSADNALGLIAYEVMVSDDLRPWTQHTEANPLYLYAVMYGGLPGSDGGVGVQNYNADGTQGGWVHSYGGKIQSRVHAWGVTNGRGLTHGSNNQDIFVAEAPPPYFPALPTFKVLSYQESMP